MMVFHSRICGNIHPYCVHTIASVSGGFHVLTISLFLNNCSEVSILKTLCHENIVRLKDIYWKSDICIYLIFEHMLCDMATYICKYEPNGIRLSALQSYVYQIANGLKFCHQRCVIHRDLKPENVLIDQNGVIKVWYNSYNLSFNGYEIPYIDVSIS